MAEDHARASRLGRSAFQRQLSRSPVPSAACPSRRQESHHGGGRFDAHRHTAHAAQMGPNGANSAALTSIVPMRRKALRASFAAFSKSATWFVSRPCSALSFILASIPEGLGESLPRYARLRVSIGLIDIVSKLLCRCAW